ncbi:tetratricopeptide repeat protein [bacterium]|nr:tetratricopeptide repeat protein [candidate division CSSED10-310 bacterium]
MAVNKNKILKNAAKYTKKGQFHKAVEEYRKLTQEEYGDNSLHNTIGDLLIRAKEIDEALLEYEKAGEFYEQRGFVPRALAIYKKVLRHDPQRTRTYQKLAVLYADQGLIQDAISQYEFLARHFEHQGNIEAALDSYRQIADLDPANISIRERLAMLYSQKGFHQKAADERIKIGEAFLKRGETVAAIKSYESALDDVPDHTGALKGIVNAHMAEGRTGEARKLLDQILDRSPDNVEALSSIGQLYMDAGQADDAIRIYQRVYSLDPSQPGVAEILGKLYIQTSNFEEAAKLLKEIINASIHHGQFQHALDLLNQLQNLDEENVSIRERKIEIYQKLNRHDDVKTMFEEIAEIYYVKGRLEESYNIYERLFSLDPQDAKVKQRFNQISIEYRGRPIETSRLVEKPSFAGMKEMASAEVVAFDTPTVEVDSADSGMRMLDLDTDERALEDLFDTSEIEKVGIPVFMDKAPPEDDLADQDLDLSEEIFTIEDDEPEMVAEARKPSLEPSDDQLREFRIEAGVYMKYGLLEKAAERLSSILISVPDDEESLDRLAEVYERMGQPDKMADVVIRRVDIMLKNGQTEQAVSIIRNALDITPGNPSLIGRLRKLEGVEADTAEASGDMAPLYPMDDEPGDFLPLTIGLDRDAADKSESPLGSAVGRGDSSTMATEDGGLSSGLAEVVREFREDLISREQEQDPETHYNLGIAYLEMGLIEEAIAEFQITTDFPDYMVKTAGLLSHCYKQTGAYDKALAIVTRAIKNGEPTDHELVSLKYELAQTMREAGHQTSAITVFREIQEETPGYRDVEDILSEYE